MNALGMIEQLLAVQRQQFKNLEDLALKTGRPILLIGAKRSMEYAFSLVQAEATDHEKETDQLLENTFVFGCERVLNSTGLCPSIRTAALLLQAAAYLVVAADSLMESTPAQSGSVPGPGTVSPTPHHHEIEP